MIFGISVVGLIIGFLIWAFWRKKAPKATIWSALFVGGIIGGTFGLLIGTGVSLLIGLAQSATSRLVGLGASTIVAVIAVIALLELFGNALAGKKAKPQRWHVGLALALPTIMVAAGFPIVSQVLATVQSAVGLSGA
jgi:hypothetical protein